MKVFVTGATGFIGSHLVKRLVQTDQDVVCLVRPTSNVGPLEKLGVHLSVGDVTKKDTVAEGMRGCDWAVNLANVYSFWEPDKSTYSRINIEGTRNVMAAALETSVAKVVHISTYGTFGKPVECPFTEDCAVVPLFASEYTRTKYAGDQIVWDYHDKHGLPLVVVHPCVVIGPGDTQATGQYIRDFIQRRLPATLFEDTQYTYVHVKDVAEAIVKVLEKPDNIGQKYIIGKHRMSIGQINQLLNEITGAPIPRLRIPGFLATITAAFCTLVANLTKKPPPWGMCSDQIRSMKESIVAEGSKAETELGIEYTPVRIAIEEMVASFQG